VVEGSPFVAGVGSIGLVGVRCICEGVLVLASSKDVVVRV